MYIDLMRSGKQTNTIDAYFVRGLDEVRAAENESAALGSA
jgi:hypothetical protein